MVFRLTQSSVITAGLVLLFRTAGGEYDAGAKIPQSNQDTVRVLTVRCNSRESGAESIVFSDRGGKRLNTYVNSYVVFDLETTGISCENDRIVEIAAVKVIDGQVTEEFSTLVNPGMPIPYRATAVHGITDDMVADAPSFDIALKEFSEFAGDRILVGHNIHAFDMRFIRRDAQRFFSRTIGNDYIDTLPLARLYLPQLEHHTLSDLAGYYGIPADGAHRALFDCRMNRQVYERLGEEIRNPSEEARRVRRCPKCGNALKLRSGKYGGFWGCTGYPDCRYTEKKHG